MESTEAALITIVSGPESIGALVRARRKAAGLTQAQAAGLAGVGNRFLSELERGKKTLEFARMLQVLERLGFDLAVVPRGVKLSIRTAFPKTVIEPEQKKAPRKRPKRGRRG
jgi:y4mF family transcriptional regulator